MLRKDPVRPGAFTPEDVARYVQALSQPGALTAAINYYRAVFRRGPVYASNILRRIDQPVLVIWGEKDRYLGAELAEPSPKWVPHVRVERLPDASHWVQVDQPERVNELLLEFFQSSSSPPPTSEHV
jgi:pimeloyl-ACP methyl ester carboxylesterase